MAFLQVALNGDRQHPGAPRTPDAIAEAAWAAVEAGAHAIHTHAFDDAGRETLDAAACAAVLRAIRGRCPGVPISLTTSAAIVPDPEERFAAVSAWTDLPDLVTANQGEEGIVELCGWLLMRGVGIEAGLLSKRDARRFVASPIRERCVRALVEAIDPDPAAALQNAAAMEAVLAEAGVTLPQVHHGADTSCWAVNRRALKQGHGIRTGMEDVVILPNGDPAASNLDLVRAASTLMAEIAEGV